MVLKVNVVLSRTMSVDVSTKIRCLIGGMENHLVHLGCIRHGSSEGNQMVHKEFKCVYSLTNKHLDSTGSEIHSRSVDTKIMPVFHSLAQQEQGADIEQNSNDDDIGLLNELSYPFVFVVSKLPSCIQAGSWGSIKSIVAPIQTTHDNGIWVRRCAERVEFNQSDSDYYHFLYKCGFAGPLM